mmetsp:Transcript_3651/g.14293  ORF Transcript_3651/g.14293 Transcript_3651/m.14293 type:complete len:208 (+) Transcript_3651:432-1055(+)
MFGRAYSSCWVAIKKPLPSRPKSSSWRQLTTADQTRQRLSHILCGVARFSSPLGASQRAKPRSTDFSRPKGAFSGLSTPRLAKRESASKISQGCGLSLEGWYRRAACMPAGLPTQRPEASRIGRQRSDSLLQVVRQASSIRPSRGRRDGPDVCRLPFLFSILRQRRSVVPPSAPAPSGTQGTDLGRRRTTRPALSLSWLCCLAPVHI